MKFRLAVEDIEKNHWIAWVLDLLGCYSSASTQNEAIANASLRISSHLNFLKGNRLKNSPIKGPIEVEVVETFHSFLSMGWYIVNGFFEDDKRPLTEEDIELGIALLDAYRSRLDTILQRVTPVKLHQKRASETLGSIAEILNHMAWAEWVYFDRFDMAFPRNEMPEDPFEQLAVVRTQTLRLLPELVGLDRIEERSGEQWSGRKILRRTLWHERDHTFHIEKILTYN